MKVRLRVIRARPSSYIISDNPSVSCAIADCSLYIRRMALKDDYHKKEWTCLHILPWVTTTLRLWERRLPALADKTTLFKKTF